MTKLKIKVFAVLASALFLFALFGAFRAAYASDADGLTENPTESTTPEDGGDGGFTALFNEKILPLIVGSGSTAIGLILILIKDTVGKRKLKKELETLREAYKQLFGRNEVFSIENEKLRAAAGQVDYTNIIQELIEKTVGEKLRMYDKVFAELSVNQKALLEQFAAFMKAGLIAWNSKTAAVNALSAAPSVQLLKKYELENALLRDKIAEFKGEEADKTIAGIAADVEMRV